MKNIFLAAATLFAGSFLFSCNNETDTTDSITTTTTDSTSMDADPLPTTDAETQPVTNAIPLNRTDSAFVMAVAMGGMMEVEAGKIAEQNAVSKRVKNFGAMLAKDHAHANAELKSLAAAKGLMLPDSLSGTMRSHVEAMRKMTGKALDNHYIKMMQDDHKKDISQFTKAANSATDADLRNWASKILPILQIHKDSVDAIAKDRR